MSQDDSNPLALRKLFASSGRPTKQSTVACRRIFDSVDDVLMVLNSQPARSRLNPLQLQIASRFATSCTLFARDMMAAEGDPDALRYLLKLPLPATDKPAD